MNLDELRAALAPLLPAMPPSTAGARPLWPWPPASSAFPPTARRLAFPGGAAEMIDAWFDWIDKAMLDAFPPERVAAMKVRDRIRALLLFRLQTLAPHREALRRALAVLAMPRQRAAGASSPGAAPTGSGASPATRPPTSTIIPSAPS